MKTRQEIESIARQKKARRLALIFLAAFAVLLAVAIAVLSYALSDKNSGEEPTETEPPEIIEGVEAIYQNYAIAYPNLNEKDIFSITVRNSHGTYNLLRDESFDNNFLMTFYDEKGNPTLLLPPIMNEDAAFEYTDLYSKEVTDGYGVFYKINYLISALQVPYFEERIELSTDEAEKASQLKRFGFTDGEGNSTSHSIVFEYYTNSEKTEKATRTVRLGGRPVSGSGYYFMIDDRPYVYNSRTNYYDYAVASFYTFVNSILIAEGLEGDSTQESLFTDEFTHYKNETHYEGTVEEDSRVIVWADVAVPITPEQYLESADSYQDSDGYGRGYSEFEIDLRKYADDKSLVNALVGAAVSGKENLEDDIIFTLVSTERSSSKLISFSLDESVKSQSIQYKYEIEEIEAILTDGADKTEGIVSEGDRIKVAYRVKIGDASAVPGICHMVIDLSEERLPAEVLSLVGKEVGKLSESLSFSIDYSKVLYEYEITKVEEIYPKLDDNSDSEAGEEPQKKVAAGDKIRVAYRVKIGGGEFSDVAYMDIDLADKSIRKEFLSLVGKEVGKELSDYEKVVYSETVTNSKAINTKILITDIISIFNSKGEEELTVQSNSLVGYRFRIIINGVDSGKSYTSVIDCADAKSEKDKAIRAKLIGRSIGKEYKIDGYSYTEYSEIFSDFMTYTVSAIRYFITRTEVVSLRYLNNYGEENQRDPFFEESIYKNMTDGYELYGLNYSHCQKVLSMLGGIGDNSSKSEGLVGSETVDVGITPEKLEKYGLYEHTVVFTLPRGFIEIDSGDDDKPNYFESYEKLTFTLHIGKLDPETKTRLVASDLYDVIARVDEEKLFFLEESFTEFWSRSKLVMFDVVHLEDLKVEFFTDELTGSYDFDVVHTPGYQIPTEDGGFKLQVGGTPPKDYKDVVDYIRVYLTTEGECTPSKATEELPKDADGKFSLGELYNIVMGEPSYDGTDTLGTSSFKEVLKMLYQIEYEGNLTAEEQAAGASAPILMRLSVKLDSNENAYVYEFRRIGDRRVMVSLYQLTPGGEIQKAVSDFYISPFALKKMANTFTALLNGEIIDTNLAYPD